MNGLSPIAFLNLGVPEMIVAGAVALLVFGPRLGRMIGQVGGTVMKFKNDVDDAKHGFTRTIEREMDSALRGKPERPRQTPPAPPSESGPDRDADNEPTTP